MTYYIDEVCFYHKYLAPIWNEILVTPTKKSTCKRRETRETIPISIIAERTTIGRLEVLATQQQQDKGHLVELSESKET